MPREVSASKAEIRHGTRLIGQVMRKLEREANHDGRLTYGEASAVAGYGSKWIGAWNLMRGIIASGTAAGSWKLDTLDRLTRDASKKLLATDANKDGRITGTEQQLAFKRSPKGGPIAFELLEFSRKHAHDSISDLQKPAKRKRKLV